MMQSTGVVRPMRLWIGVLVFAAGALCTSVTASAQAYRWYDWFAGLPRVRSTQSCAIQFRGELVVSMPGYGFRAWNGSSWRALPPVALTADVMAVFGDRLYAAGSGKLISFDGSSWAYHGSVGGIVKAMIPFNGELIIGGFFTKIGGVNANRIARFNGVRFAPIGGGFNAGFVGALATLNGKLFAAGSFGSPTNRLPPGVTDPNRVAFWNGSGWQTAGTGLNSTVEALTVYNGKLIAGGWFNIAGPGSGARVAQFDGTNWTSLSPTFNKNVSTIFTLASTNNGIVAGGYFHNTEGFVGAMFFNGTDWVAMDGGLTTTNGLSYVWNSTTFRDQFVLLGDFELSGAVPAFGMAVWGPGAGASGLRVDTNSDGRRDIMLRNPLTGMLRSWQLDSNLNPTSRDIIFTGTDWDMVGTGDFNADGETDFLWFQASTGRVHMSMFRQGNYLAPREMRGSPRANLVIATVADFNGDGIPDILWRDTSNGEQGVWLLNAAGAPTFRALPNVPITEEVVLAADFDNDGVLDIVYRTKATGALYSRKVTGTTLGAAVAITPPASGWTLVSVADYNADQRTDRLWVRTATGEVQMQLMGASGVQSTKVLPNLPVGFVVKR